MPYKKLNTKVTCGLLLSQYQHVGVHIDTKFSIVILNPYMTLFCSNVYIKARLLVPISIGYVAK